MTHTRRPARRIEQCRDATRAPCWASIAEGGGSQSPPASPPAAGEAGMLAHSRSTLKLADGIANAMRPEMHKVLDSSAVLCAEAEPLQ
jgi:hypothetical protein